MSSNPEIPLSPAEQTLWNWAVLNCTSELGIDPIEQAAQDCRVTGALKVMILGTSEYYDCCDFEDITKQLQYEYCLKTDEVMTAFDIAEDRILREQT